MQKNKRLKLNKSTIEHMLKFFGFSGTPVRSIVVVLGLGISLGVAYFCLNLRILRIFIFIQLLFLEK